MGYPFTPVGYGRCFVEIRSVGCYCLYWFQLGRFEFIGPCVTRVLIIGKLWIPFGFSCGWNWEILYHAD